MISNRNAIRGTSRAMLPSFIRYVGPTSRFLQQSRTLQQLLSSDRRIHRIMNIEDYLFELLLMPLSYAADQSAHCVYVSSTILRRDSERHDLGSPHQRGERYERLPVPDSVHLMLDQGHR